MSVRDDVVIFLLSFKLAPFASFCFGGEAAGLNDLLNAYSMVGMASLTLLLQLIESYSWTSLICEIFYV